MKRTWLRLAIATLFLAACGTQSGSEPTAAPPTETLATPTSAGPAVTAEPPAATPSPAVQQAPEAPLADYTGLSLPLDRNDLFAGSGVCAVCHTQMVDESGADVSIDAAWRSTMMANAARDPYWQASVRREVLSNPQHQGVIEDLCATCHMPMAHFTGAAAGVAGQVLDAGLSDPAHDLHPIAMDGVSCTLCHQIRPDGFGEHESFDGGYAIDAELPPDARKAFGPYPIGMGMIQIMQSSSGFVPVRSMHVGQSELCATCHTVYTPFVDASGQVAGQFPEQVPYLEWQASAFSQSLSCQGCHMPTAQGGVRISVIGGHHLRSPFFQHMMVGGNVFVLDMLRAFGEELSVTTSSAQFETKQAQTIAQLQGRTATLDLENVGTDGSMLTADVVVRTMTGHKFPTAYPSRRAWLHVIVQDAAGNVLFESGAVNADGYISGNDNDTYASAYEPHYLSVNSPDQVQIYEGIMGDTEGRPTTTLVAGAQYLKDNRLLPAGLDKATAQADMAVHGAAADDADFLGATDRTRYTITLNGAQGPLTVTAELLYQSIGYRWADNLRGHDAPEPARFLEYYEQVPNRAVVIASATVEVGE